MSPRLIAILLFFIPCIPNYAQSTFKERNDSLLYAQADSAFSLSFRNSDSALLLANEVLKKSTQSNYTRSVANAWNAKGWALMHKGFLDSSINCLQQSWQLFSKAGYENDIIKVCINISEVYTKQNKIAPAIKYLTQADSLCLKNKNTVYHTNVFRQLGVVYRESGDRGRATFYLKKAQAGFLELKDYFRYISTGISLSILYRNMNLPDSSLAILEECIRIQEHHPPKPYQATMLQEHIAESYYQKKQYEKALLHYTNAYIGFKKLNNKGDIAFESISVGKTLWKLNRIEQAEKYLVEAYTISDTLKMFNYQYDAANILAEMYQKTGNWQKAFHYLHNATMLKDTIDLANQVQATNELKEKFESEKKEQEIGLLKARNELTAADNRRSRLLQYIFILLFIAAVAIGWLLINRSGIKRKLDAQILRNQIASDLHDDIGSALSAIDIGSRVAMARNNDHTAVQEQVTRIRQHARKTLDSMGDIVWSVNPANDNLESLLVRLKEFAAEMCELAQIRLQFSVSDEVQKISLGTMPRKNLFLICKEAVNNAVKSSGCTTLTISFTMPHKKEFRIMIQDDGKGFDETTIKKGNGLSNMRLRAANIQARLVIESVEGKGTNIEINCPV